MTELIIFILLRLRVKKIHAAPASTLLYSIVQEANFLKMQTKFNIKGRDYFSSDFTVTG
jgi:hypothetical protein